MDCANLSELTRAEWSHSLLRQLNGSRYPLGGTFELTERCNLACVHCFINQPVGCKAASAREMSLTQIRGLFDQLASVGCLWLLLTGGEVLLRPDFLEIYEYAKRRGLLLTLFTNGTLLTPRIADFLAEFPPVRLEITLYGLTPQTYERVTGVPGSHARCLRGIELALDRGLPLGLKAVVLRANQHELEGMQRFADGLGTDFRYDGMLWPRLDGGGKANPCQIPAAEVAALDMDGAQRHAAWNTGTDQAVSRPGWITCIIVVLASMVSILMPPDGSACA
jgi:MoaA/NifB/PqqE/SkfB family radical SAM enzyme